MRRMQEEEKKERGEREEGDNRRSIDRGREGAKEI